jgi:hypothetical protein
VVSWTNSKMMLHLKRGAMALVVVSVAMGCGRYKVPVPPEMVAPKPVDALTATATESGVVFAWTAPDEDQRGKELKSIEGYSIERKVIAEKGDETNPKVRFEPIGFVKDSHVEIRESLRTAARKEGKIGRTIEAPEENTKFTFVDSKTERDKTYMYQIVPQNQGGTDGGVREFVRVTFKGAASDVSMVPVTDAPMGVAVPDDRPGFF